MKHLHFLKYVYIFFVPIILIALQGCATPEQKTEYEFPVLHSTLEFRDTVYSGIVYKDTLKGAESLALGDNLTLTDADICFNDKKGRWICEKESEVKSCSDYWALKRRGWISEVNKEIKLEHSINRICDGLRIAVAAQSYRPDSRSGELMGFMKDDLLPISLISDLFDRFSMDPVCAPLNSVDECILSNRDDFKVTVFDGNFTFHVQDNKRQFLLSGVGDLNGDGLKDFWYWQTTESNHGTFRSGKYVCLYTQKSDLMLSGPCP